MTRLIDALLSLSRVEMNAHVPPSDLVDLNDVIDHAKDTLEPLAREMSFRLDVGRFPRPAVVRGDRDELVQVLQNLVQNAFKYGEQGGSQVRIEAKHIPSLGRQAGRYAIAVIDKGPGIAPEHLPRLTERFYRVDVASSREKGGTGLGLAIVKHILNRHRGELAIASTARQGLDLHRHAERGEERAARSRSRRRIRLTWRRRLRWPAVSPALPCARCSGSSGKPTRRA